MQKNHVACKAGILGDLERNPVHFFHALVETNDRRIPITLRVQITNVRMRFQVFAKFCAARASRWRMLLEPLMDDSVASRSRFALRRYARQYRRIADAMLLKWDGCSIALPNVLAT